MEMIEFKDNRGSLIPLEFSQLPFVPQRIFYVKDVPAGTTRGEHAHYETQQVLICLKGSVLVHIEDVNGVVTERVLKSDEIFFIDKMMWDYQKFLEEDTILLVLCSTKYDKNDYILDKNLFYKLSVNQN